MNRNRGKFTLRNKVAIADDIDDRNDIETKVAYINDSGHFPFTSDKFYDEISTFYEKIC